MPWHFLRKKKSQTLLLYQGKKVLLFLGIPRSETYPPKVEKRGKFLPLATYHRGAVANMLVTSCLDNVCRLWCETVLPEDGGPVSVAHLDPGAAGDSKFRTHRQKARFIQRFRHMR